MLIPRNILTILSLCFANIRPPDFVRAAISREFLYSSGLFRLLFLLILFAFVSGNELSAQTTFTKSIVTSTDDAEEEGVGGTYHGPGAVYTTGIYLELVNDFQTGGLGIQTVGMRFTSVTIPKNAIISNAYFTFRCMTPDVNNDNSSTCNLTIKGQAADNPSTFVSSSTPTYSISTRPTTTASVAWSPAAWTPGSDYTSANITTIVQELVNRSGWVSNNAMAFIITGSGTRTSQSYDDPGTNQPILTVTYTPFNLSTAVTNVNCPGGVTGAINLSITGGNSPFTYVWDNGATTQNLSGLEAGVYSVTVTDALGNKVSTSATVTEPTITTQPLTSQSLCNGGSPSTLSVVLSGGGSINYQWYSNTVNSTVGGTPIGGATSSGYTPPGNVVGTVYYYCGITKSGCTTIYSNTATVNVLADPTITVQPVNSSICVGGTYNPTITATGGTPSLVYQWQYSNNGSSWANVTNGTPANASYANANSASSFTVSGNIAAGTYYYRCSVSATGSGCDPVNSNNGVLTIVADPVITLQPVGYTACVGSFYAPTINATGGTPSLNYQWQYSANGSSGWANVSDGIPANATYIGANTSNAFEVDGNISAGTYYYRCAVTATGSGCDAVYSANGVYTIAADPAISAQPASATICFGGTFAPDVTATGGTPSLTYQWQYSANGSTGWADVANGVPANSIYTSPTNPTAFTVTGNIATGTYFYRCKVMASGTECDPTFSNNAVLTIVSDPSITSHPGNATICVNGTYNPTVSATGGAPSLVYQWQYSANGSTGWANVVNGTPANSTYTNASSATLFTVAGSIAAGTYYYRCAVSATGSGCDAVNSNNGILTIVADPAISVQPSNATVCSGGTYSPTITATGGTPSLTYQWQYSANGSSGWTDVADGTPANATYSNPTSSNTFSVSGILTAGTYYYHCIASATGSGCGSATSNNGVLTVVNDPTITVQPISSTICTGNTYAPTITATGGTPSLTYQWQYSANGSTGWANVANGTPTNSTYTNPTSATTFTVGGAIAAGTYYYRCLVSSSGNGCDQAISNTGVLTIVSTPVITSQPTDGTICLGGSFNPTISAIGGTPTYQWQYSITGLALWSNVTNGVPLNATYTNTTSPTLFTVTGNIIAGNYYYRCIVSSTGCSAATSNTATLTIVADPAVSVQPVSATICRGGTYNPSITATGGTPFLNYQWQYSTASGGPFSNVVDGTPANAVYSNVNSATLFAVNGNIAAGTYYYRCQVSATGSGCGTVNSSNGVLTVVADPSITVQPLSPTICVGGTYAPTITATGGTPSKTYQWQYSDDGTNNWNNVSNGTPANATYANVTSATSFTVNGNIDPGSYYYRCVVSSTGSGCDDAITNNGVLTVVPDPYITSQPNSATNCVGNSFITSVVVAGGTPSLTYQWQRSANGTSSWTNVANGTPANASYSGQTTANLTVTGNIAAGTYYYRCVISSGGSGCDQVISNNAVLTVVSTPSISAQPSSSTICFGGVFNPTIIAVGGSPTYQWQRSPNGSSSWANVTNGTPSNASYSGQTSASLTVSGNIAIGTYYYRCIVSSSGCSSTATSTTAILTIVADPSVTGQPSNATICSGGIYSPTITATGGTPSLDYQWQFSSDGSNNWTNVLDGTPSNSIYSNPNSASTFSVTGDIAAGTYYYRCIASASGSGCGNATSNNGVLTVIADPAITAQPANASICVGGTYTPTITATGGTPSLAYQWQYSADGSTGWVNVVNSTPANATYSGATTSGSFTVTGSIAAGTYYYRCAVTSSGSGCDAINSNNGVLTVISDPAISTQPSNASICVGGTYNATVVATGGTPSLSYQWQFSTDGSTNWNPVSNGAPANSTYSGNTTASLTVNGNIGAGNYYYRCVISSSGSGCDPITSNTGILTVTATPSVTSQPASASICVGGTYAPTVTATGGTPSLTYQWQYSADGSTGWANVTNGIPANSTYTNPTSALSFTVTGSIGAGSYYYRCVVSASGVGCGSVNSNTGVLTVVSDPAITAQPSNASICVGGTYAPTITATGGTPSLSYQWQYSVNGSTGWGNVTNGTPANASYSNATTASLSVTGNIAAGSYYYRCTVSSSGSGCDAINSNNGVLTVVADPAITAQPSNASICVGGTYAPTVTATGGTPSLGYQWQFSTDGTNNWNNVVNGTPANASYANATSSTTFTVTGNIGAGTYYYRCVVTASGSGCDAINSNTGILTVIADPAITAQPSNASICVGGTYAPTVTATGGTPSLAYQWQYSADGSTGWANVAAGTPANAVYSNPTSASLFNVTGSIAAGTYYYRCAVSAAGSGCDPINTNNAVLTILADPSISSQPTSTTICVGGVYSPTVTATGGTPSLSYQWQFSADGSTGWANVINNTPANASYSGATTAGSFLVSGSISSGNYYYRCVISSSGNGCDNAISNTGILTILSDPSITVQPVSATICTGGTFVPTITATGGTPSLTYQWQYSANGSTGWADVVNNTPANASYSGATTAGSFSVTGNIASGIYYYHCNVLASGSGCDPVSSNTAILTVASDPAITVQPINATVCVGGTYSPTITATGGTPSLTYQWQYSGDGLTGWSNVINNTPFNSTYSNSTSPTLFTVSGNIPAGNYYYRCVVSSSGSGCDPITSNNGVLTVTADPGIASQPANATICVGGTYSPTITTTGGTPSLTYQWQFSADGSTGWTNAVNGTPSNSIYSNSNSASLFTVTGNIAAGTYYYRCVVSASGSGCDPINSNNGVLTVIADPNITSQPVNATICVGGTYTPSITASGGTPSLSYQWQYSTDGSTGWANVVNGIPANSTYSNVTSATLFSVTGGIAAGTYYYRCQVSSGGSGCDPINSNTGILTINADPNISSQPANATICVGGTYSPTISATGGTPSLSYQWQYSADGSSGWANVTNGIPANASYSNGTSASLFSVTGNIASGSYYYRCVVSASGSGCDPINSNVGILTVNADPSITSQPSNATICSGGTYNPTITATGGTPALNYQWQFSADGSSGWANVSNGLPLNAIYSNSTSASLFSVTGGIASGTYYYRCVVSATGSGCNTINSNNAVLTVVAVPAVSSQPANATICIGGSYSPTVTATGGTPSLTYQWQYSADGSTGWSNVTNGIPANASYSNATSASLFTVTGNIVAGSYYYRCLIAASGSGCGNVASNNAILTIVADPNITSQPSSANICFGGVYTPTITASGGTPSLTYQWQYSADGSTGWTNVTNGIPANSTYSGVTSASSFNISGNIAAGTYYYRCAVSSSGSGCDPVYSNNGILTVEADPSISVQPSGSTICYGGTFSPTISATGGTPSLTYQWQLSLDGLTGWANVVNGIPVNAIYNGALTAASFSVSGNIPTGTYYYRCVVSASGSGCNAINSNSASLTILNQPSISSQPVSSQSTCLNGIPSNLNISVTGGTGSFSYQWYSNTINSNSGGSLINGETNTVYTPPTNSIGTVYYYCIISQTGSGCGPITSNVAAVTVVDIPMITNQPVSDAICIGGTYAPSVTATGGTPVLTYKWQYSTNGTNGWADVINGIPTNAIYAGESTSSSFTINGSIAPGTYYYRCVILASGSGCNTIYSNNAILTIHAQPIFTTQPLVTQSVCVNGSPTNLSVSISGGSGTITYQWYSNIINSNSGGTLILGATASSYSPPTSAVGTSYYYCKVSNSGSGCGDIFSNTAEIIVISSPTIITQPVSESICTGGFYAPFLIATGGTPSLSYQWQYSINGTSGWSNVLNGLPTNADYSGATTANAFIISGNISTGTYYYRCIVSSSGSGCIDAISNTVSLTIVAQPTVSVQPLITQTICKDGIPTDLIVSATGGTGTFTYQWYSNIVNSNSGGSIISGATNISYTALTNTLGTVYYYCEIAQSGSACGPIYSNTAAVNVIISPSIIMQPDSATICRGGTYNPVISATGGTPSLTYQWQYSSDGINGWANVANGTPTNSSYAGATTASSFIVSGNLLAGVYYYQCIVSASGSGCSSITSNPAVLTIVADPAVVTQPVSATICYSGTYSPTVVASGGTPSLSYQWQFSPNTTSSNFANVVDGVPAGAVYSGANTPDDFHVMGNIAVGSAYYYRCVISSSGSGCGTVISGNGRMTIVADIAVTAQPASATICVGGSSFAPNVTATGGTPTKLYQWQYSPDGISAWTDLIDGLPTGATYTGATTATGLAVNGLKNIPGVYYYRCAIWANGSGCDTSYSNPCVYTVVADPYIVSGPTLDTICYGGIYAPVVVGGGGTPSLNYNWQRSANGTSGWGNVTNNTPVNAIYSGQNTASSFMVTGNIAPGTYYYRCQVSASGSGCTTFSGPAATLKILAQPTVTTQPLDSQTLCYNAIPTDLNVGSSGGNGTFSYQWYVNTINSNSGGIPLGALNGANTSSFTPPTNIDGTFYYYCEISQTGTGCGPIYSNVATVIVTPELVFNLSSQTNVDCYGNGNGTVTVSPTGGTSPYTYNINGGTFQSSPTFSGLSGGTYTIIIKDNNNCTLSQDISITEPSAALSVTITDTTNVLCNGDATGGAIASSSGGTSPYTYVWSNGNLTFDLTNVVAGTYTVTVTDAHNCTSSISVPITEANVVGVNITQDVSWYMISAPAPGINYGDFLNGFATQGYPGSSYPDKQPNLIWFDETDTLTTNISWRTIGNSSQVMTPGRGYYFFVFGTVPGDPLYDVVLPKQLYVNNCIVYAQPFSYTNATFPITFTPRNGGKVSNGPNDTVFIETNLADQGWNLLGNPTGKSLDWNASGWTKTNIDNSIYVWDPVDKEFKVFNGVTGTHNGQISPFQSFWVRAHGPNPVLSFTDEVFSDGGVFLRGGDTTINIAHYSIPFKLGIDNLSANSFITFMDEGRDGPDKWDAFQIKPLSDTWLEVYTTASESQTVPLVINNLPFEGKDYYNLPLYVGGKKNQVPIKGDFKLEWEIPDNWPADWSVSLHDHLTQKVIPMRSQKNYVFNYQSENLLGNGQGHEKGLIHLPSSIVETITDKKSNEVRSGSAPFSVVIEKKKPVDPDYIASTTKLLRNYPNPFSSKTNIKFSLPQPGNITLELFDVNGRLLDVIADNVYYPGGINTIVWVNKSINNGIYLLRIKSDTGNDVIKLNIIK